MLLPQQPEVSLGHIEAQQLRAQLEPPSPRQQRAVEEREPGPAELDKLEEYQQVWRKRMTPQSSKIPKIHQA